MVRWKNRATETSSFQCEGFAFKDTEFNSSCVLLKNRTNPNQICSAEATMFRKKPSGNGGKWCYDAFCESPVYSCTFLKFKILEKLVCSVLGSDEDAFAEKEKQIENSNRTWIEKKSTHSAIGCTFLVSGVDYMLESCHMEKSFDNGVNAV